MIIIDGTDLPTPTNYEVSQSDLDSSDSSRNELGILIRNRVRQGMYKLNLEFRLKSSSDMQIILSAIEPDSFQVTFPTPAGMITKKMYVGDRSGPKTKRLSKNFDEINWDITFSLIEY